MPRIAAAIAMFALLAAVLSGSAQEPVQPKSDTPTSNDVITLSGCLRGSTLVRIEETTTRIIWDALLVSEVALQSSRELLQTLRTNHEGHHIEVTGGAKIPPRPRNQPEEVQTVDLGRGGRVTIGQRRRSAAPPTQVAPTQGPIAVAVKSFKHLADACNASVR
jgi:hypothetical protein